MSGVDLPGGALRLGTRRSALALAQSGLMARALEARWPGLAVELVPIVATGDIVPGDLSKAGGKGLFTEELERGLLDGSLDLAVHSMKDLPVRLPEGLIVAAHPQRADPRDALVSEAARTSTVSRKAQPCSPERSAAAPRSSSADRICRSSRSAATWIPVYASGGSRTPEA